MKRLYSGLVILLILFALWSSATQADAWNEAKTPAQATIDLTNELKVTNRHLDRIATALEKANRSHGVY